MTRYVKRTELYSLPQFQRTLEGSRLPIGRLAILASLVAQIMLPLIAAQMNSVWSRIPTFLQNVSHESCECNATVPARFAKTYEDNLLALGAICDELLQLLLHAREQR